MKNTEPLKELKDELVTNSYIADHHENNEIVLRASRAFEISADIIEKTVRQAIINERERTVREVIKLIKKYFDEHEKANSSFTMYDLLIKFIKELL